MDKSTIIFRLAKIGDRGQITIPKNARERMGFDTQESVYLAFREEGLMQGNLLILSEKMLDTLKNRPQYKELKIYGPTIIEARGQIIVPKEIRDELQIKSGQKYMITSHFFKPLDIYILIMLDARFLEFLARQLLQMISGDEELEGEFASEDITEIWKNILSSKIINNVSEDE